MKQKGVFVMKLGTFTVVLGELPFEKACAFLAENGVQMVEIGCGGFPGKAFLPIWNQYFIPLIL